MGRTLTVINALGLILVMFSLTLLLPLFTALLYHEQSLFIDFLLAMLVTAAAGVLMWLLTRRYKGELSTRHGYLLVVAMWSAMPAFGTLPLLLALPGLSFTDAYFETMSGITTTGATVLTGLDSLSPAINIWRHEMEWLGGLGIIVLAVAVLPLLGIGGRQLFKAETPGPMKETALTPRIADTARNLWVVYAIITLACIGALKWAGMSWLDAVCHGFSTTGLGGFSTHDASVGWFDSPLIEFVMIVFMLFAVINFATHFLAWRGKTLRVYLFDTEAQAALGLIVASCFGIAFFLWFNDVYPSFATALRHASFNVVSIGASSGFASVDYAQWPIFAPLWMLFVGCIAASSGSTGGGIKMMRTLVLVKQAGREFIKLLHPNAINPMKIGGHVVQNNIVFAVLGFIFLYFMVIAGMTFVLLISGLDFISAFTATLACVNNFGPGLGLVGPAANYAGLTDFQTWICSFGMLVGRLEIFTVLILFTPAFWKR
ncbi:MAG: TrkH family potassium uptake protein [Gallionella sp.]|nr:TrkH family potassium uptake protein [Gallionella sp.]OIO10911.1 MAG: potassium transporter Trk [Gallionellaceae bacterium CG1_02_60_325]PIR09190.1 MAG: potassium transporter Trk [Gallionellaceae bacterium CG11_big_fil_rev_8_21_14_0_20_60_62]PJC05081.1 MAG: potassium transporter Trk [Gallionellaceae bacterium CG_4_9_14_0_8_um_filter_60_335]NCP80492.1 TrkH family potassium uptake protein [Gallionella sp.]